MGSFDAAALLNFQFTKCSSSKKTQETAISYEINEFRLNYPLFELESGIFWLLEKTAIAAEKRQTILIGSNWSSISIGWLAYAKSTTAYWGNDMN